MGGRNGLTLAEFGRMSDRQIYALLCVTWDEETGALITEWEREPVLDGEHTGSLKRAAQELPSPESLGIDDETLIWALSLRDGSRVTAQHDSGVPATDVADQGKRLEAKFAALVDPVLGADKTAALIVDNGRFDTLADVRGLMRLTGEG